MRKFLMATLAATAMAFSVAQSASAGTIILNTSAPDSGLGQTQFGFVTYTNGTGALTGGVNVTVTLTTGYNFVETGNGNSHTGFAFYVTKDIAAADIKNITAGGFASTATPYTFATISPAPATPFGSFGGGIDCVKTGSGNNTVCGNGAPGFLSPLAFYVAGVTEQMFADNKSGWVFAADVVNLSTKSTGSVVGSMHQTDVPEPASIALLGAGLVDLGLKNRRRA